MKSQIKPLAWALFLAMGSQAMVSADTLFDNSDGANYTTVRIDQWAASPFFTGDTQCAPSCGLDKINLKLQVDGFFEVTNFTDFHLEIYDDNGDSPGDTLIGTMVKTSPAGIPSDNFTNIFFAPAGEIQLQQGTTYWVKFSNNSVSEEPIAWEWAEEIGGKRAAFLGGFGLLTYSDQQYKMRVDVIPSTGGPGPKALANGSEGPVTLAIGQNLSVAITLDPADYSGVNADYWVIAYSANGGWVQYQYPAGWATLDASFIDIKPAYQGPLVDLSTPLELFSSSDLPPDSYEVFFGVDRNMNGILDTDTLNYGSVKILIQ